MIVKYKETDLFELYSNMYEVVRLGEIARIIPGYYSKYGSIFKLIDCKLKNNLRIEGYSKELQRDVILERDAVRALITANDVDDFIDANYMEYTTYLITADHHDEDFKYNYPLTAKYLQECFSGNNKGSALDIETIIRPSIREAMDKKKLILSVAGDISHAMSDSEANVVPTVGSYLCTFPGEDWQTIVAYMAILNSRTFSYMLYHRSQESDLIGSGRKSLLEDLPVPRYTSEFIILNYLSECLLYLSKPYFHPISKRISNERIGYYLTKILDMVVYELYFPEYVRERNLNAIEYINSAPFMQSSIVDDDIILQTYQWFQRPENVIRQMIEVLDTRSPELLYKIQKFNPDE